MGTTAQKLQAILDSKADIKDAIEQKGVEVGSTPLAGYAQKILDIPSGGEDEPYTDDAVRFFDYDGKQLLGMSKEDFLALDAMPANPATHDELVFTEWSHTLAEVKNYVSKYDYCDVMALYDTVDGKTRVTIRVDAGDIIPIEVSWSTIKISWGDGEEETVTAQSTQSFIHTYIQTGIYIITLEVVDGKLSGGYTLFGQGTVSDNPFVSSCLNKVIEINYGSVGTSNVLTMKGISLLKHSGSQFISKSQAQGINPSNLQAAFINANIWNTYAYAYNSRCIIFKEGLPNFSSSLITSCYKVDRILLPTGQTAVYGSFAANCYSARHIVIPDGVKSISGEAFLYCLSVNEIIIPNGVTSISTGAFRGCISAVIISFPEGLESIGNYAFANCQSVNSLTLPSTITSIGNYAFYNKNNLAKLTDVYVKSTTPPTLGSNAFPVNVTFTIHVPQGSLATYQAATNWSAYAQYMVDDITE